MSKSIKSLIFTAVFCLLCIFASSPSYAAEYSGQCGDDVYWNLSEDGTMTLSGTGYMWEFADEYGDYRDQIRLLVVEEGIKSLGVNSFADCSSLEKVILPDDFQCIDRQAFLNCTALKEINIPSTVTAILNNAFNHCTSLYEIDLSATNGLFIADYAFYYSGLKYLELPDSIRSIGYNSFMSCGNLEYIDLGEGLEDIPYRAFAYCTRLNEVRGGSAVDFLMFNAFLDCPCVELYGSNLKVLNNWVVGATGNPECLTIPEGITVIAEYAFDECKKLYELHFEGDLPYLSYIGTPKIAVFPADNSTWSEFAYKKKDSIDMCIPSDHIHEFATEAVKPGMFECGYSLHTCSVCGYYYYTDFIDQTMPYHTKEWQLLQETNRERYKADINPLTGFALMQRFADIRADESVFRVSNGHTRPDGSSYRTIPAEIGLTGYTNLRENLYWETGYDLEVNPQKVVKSWMNSPTHREAIMMPSLTSVGLGFKMGQNPGYDYYNATFVQNFVAGGTYNSFRIVAEAGLTVEQGTAIEQLPVYAELNNTVFGISWLPLIEEYCTGYDPEAIGSQTVTVSALGYNASFEVTVVEKEHKINAKSWFYASSCTRPGYRLYWCDDCEYTYMSDYEKPSGHSFGDWGFAAPGSLQYRYCKDCGAAESRVAPKESPFTDVKEKDFFFDPVLWAVEKGVTSGLSKTEFGPAAGCTRAQVVTFLWRAAGKPAPESTENPFKDVAEGQYYYDAVLWAVENGITTGLSADTFGPNANCNRGQIVTFLWRAMGKPAPNSSDNPFADVADSQYYYDAVLWAVEKGITTGMGANSFAPNSTCTRGQIVTFLYRAYQ